MVRVYLQVQHQQFVVNKNNDGIIIHRFVSLDRLLFFFSCYHYYHLEKKKKEKNTADSMVWYHQLYSKKKTIDGQQLRLICAIFMNNVVVVF
jgi:hypothetical protein